MEQIVLDVPTIDCDVCVRNIRRTIERVSGVHEVLVDLPTRRVTVSFDPTTLTGENVREHLAAAGFAVD